jgi:hypothetical protein
MAFKMKGSPMQRNFGLNTPMQGKGYVSDAQRKAVHASKADGGKGNPNKLLGDLNKDGELSGYEKNRQEAIEENMEKSKDKSPLEQKKKKLKDLDKAENMPVKTSGLGPRTAFGGVKNPELTSNKKKKDKKVFKDGSNNTTVMNGKTIDFKNRYAEKSDFQKKVDAKKAAYDKMSKEEKKKLQAAADAKRKAFEKKLKNKK